MTSSTDLGLLTAQELVALYKSGDASPVEAAKAALARIEKFNPAVNAYVHVDPEGALSMAKASEVRWRKGTVLSPVDGVPTSIKDLTYAKGMPTRKGSYTTNPDGPWDVDAPFTQRMREGGAVLLGKTSTPEFGWKGVTDSPLQGITRNPWNIGRTAGGSSGGAAAAATLNMGVLHQGSDAGGSIRIPCGFCGVFGMKPTFGLIPQWPASAMTTLSHLGVIARSVEDGADMLNLVARPDSRDFYAANGFPEDWRRDLDRPLKGLKIAYSRDLGYAKVRPDIAARVDAAVAVLSDLGAAVELRDPGFDDPIQDFDALWHAGAAFVLESVPEAMQARMDPELVAIAKKGRAIPMARYMKACDARTVLYRRMAEFHKEFDLLVTPSLPLTAFAAGINAPEAGKSWVEWTPFTYPFNMTQQPTSSVPCGFADDGLPVGLHIVGAKFNDLLVMQTSRAFAAAMPATFPDAPKPGV